MKDLFRQRMRVNMSQTRCQTSDGQYGTPHQYSCSKTRHAVVIYGSRFRLGIPDYEGQCCTSILKGRFLALTQQWSRT
jgi:hypothetical protein